MSTDKAEAAEKFARTLNRVDAIQGRARSYIEALVREVESLSDALVERDVKLVERDAAVAAIERVRAINTGNNRALYGNDFEAGMAKALWLVKAALDGAPEPEWEYGWMADEARRSTMSPRGPRLLIDGLPHSPEEIARFPRGQRVRRVKAGPWLPVEGEGK